MTPFEKQAFRNFFWTAQLGAGLAAALRMWWDAGMLGAIAGFAFVVPFAAVAAWIKVLSDRWFPPKPGPQKTRWVGAILFGLIFCAVLVGVSLLLRDYV